MKFESIKPRKATFGFKANGCSPGFMEAAFTIIANVGSPSPDTWWYETAVSNGDARVVIYTNDASICLKLRELFA